MHASTLCCSAAGARAALLALALLGAPTVALAHKASDAYVQLSVTDVGLALRVDVALRDLDAVLDIDADGDARLSWGEVRAAWPAIEAYVTSHVGVEPCALGTAVRSLERRSDGVYAALAYAPSCTVASMPAIRYTLFADLDDTHRGIARVSMHGGPATVQMLDPRQASARKPIGAPEATPVDKVSAAAAATPVGFLREGVLHIVTGYDHVLFLLCLLSPAALRRTRERWLPHATLRAAAWPVLGIVTAFTLAHSITLALAALQWVALPASFIEPAIAVSIVLAALNNLWPIFRGRVVFVTFVFGLLHGFGFAGVLGELNLPAAQFAWALLQFNVGLEFGQVLIVCVAVALMFPVRHHRRYVPVVVHGGSVAAMLVGVVWFVERAADLNWLPL